MVCRSSREDGCVVIPRGSCAATLVLVQADEKMDGNTVWLKRSRLTLGKVFLHGGRQGSSILGVQDLARQMRLDGASRRGWLGASRAPPTFS